MLTPAVYAMLLRCGLLLIPLPCAMQSGYSALSFHFFVQLASKIDPLLSPEPLIFAKQKYCRLVLEIQPCWGWYGQESRGA